MLGLMRKHMRSLATLVAVTLVTGLTGCGATNPPGGTLNSTRAANLVLIIADGMHYEHERAYNDYLTGSYDSGLEHLSFPYRGAASTWDVTTYNRYAYTAGSATISSSTFDPQVASGFTATLGYDPARGGAQPYPLSTGATVSSVSSLSYYGALRSNGTNSAVPATDSASAGTALATGFKTDDGNIAWRTGDPENGRLATIAEMYRTQKKAAIGVVTTVPFSHATPAAFVSHNKSRSNYKAIAQEIVTAVRPDVVIGGGHPLFSSATVTVDYTYIDGPEYANLKNSVEYSFAERAAAVDGGATLLAKADQAVSNKKKLFGLFGGVGGNFEYHTPASAGTPTFTRGSIENPTLAQASTAALKVLSQNTNGFFLMIEQGDIDWANHANDYRGMIGGMWDLDGAVKAVEAFIDLPGDAVTWDNTLVIVTSDHGNSFMRIDATKKLAKGTLPQQNPRTDGGAPAGYSTAVSYYYPSRDITFGFDGMGVNSHTNEPVTIYARGAGAGRFSTHEGTWYPGTKLLDNTHIYQVMLEALGLMDDNRRNAASLSATVYTLPDTYMQELNPALTDLELAQAVAINGAKTVMKPGIGSGLTPDPSHAGSYFMITDRGINEDYTGPGGGKTFPLPAFTPTIAKVHFTAAGEIAIDSVLPITAPTGTYVTGISNTALDDTPYTNQTSTIALPYNPDGLDTEDLQVLPNGDLLVVEEYGPSIAVVDHMNGAVRMRYLPSSKTDLYTAATCSIRSILPGILDQRRANRGFESLALSGDGKTAYAVMQSPIGDKALTEYKNTRVVRIIRLDVTDPLNASVTGHFVVLQSAVGDYARNAAGYTVTNKQTDMKYSAAAWLGADRILLLERANGKMKLMNIDMTIATNMSAVGHSCENTLDPEDTVTAGKGLAGCGIVPAGALEVFSTDELPALVTQTADKNGSTPTYEVKLEGMAIKDDRTILLANDNDFGIGDPTLQSKVWTVTLKNTLNR